MHSVLPHLSRPSWPRPRRRPLSVTCCGAAAPEIHEAIVTAWLHAFDLPADAQSERRLLRWVMRELRVGPASARALVRAAQTAPGPARAFALLRRELDRDQRERVLRGARHLSASGVRDSSFDRIALPVLSQWLGLEPTPVSAPTRRPSPNLH